MKTEHNFAEDNWINSRWDKSMTTKEIKMIFPKGWRPNKCDKCPIAFYFNPQCKMFKFCPLKKL